MKKYSSRRLERFRSSKNVQKVVEKQGCGKKLAREAKALNIKAELQKQKVSGKAVTELAGLDVAALKGKLAEVRKELFDLRFKHATGQLQNVAAIPATKRQIARILTLIGQKDLGA